MIFGAILVIEFKAYCLDTSGLSNPLGGMPEDIYSILWSKIIASMIAGKFAVTKEIYDELSCLNGSIGDCIKKNKAALLLEIGEANWDWALYIQHVNRMRDTYKDVISEYNNNRKGTIGLTDLSIVALAKCLNLPVISMEALSFQTSQIKIRIPGLCNLENVPHMDFNQFLRTDGIKI